MGVGELICQSNENICFSLVYQTFIQTQHQNQTIEENACGVVFDFLANNQIQNGSM